METLGQLGQKQYKSGEIILGVLLICYILTNMGPPQMIAEGIDSVLGKLLIFCFILYLFVQRHFVLGILSIWAFYDLMRKSSAMTGNDALKRWMPTEQKKYSELSAFNQFPYTLEQEMVSKMTTAHFNTGTSLTKYSWKPNLEPAFRDSIYVNKM